MTKLNAGGSMAYSTFVGGSYHDSGNDFAGAIAVDASGAIYITGETSSGSFPTTAGAYDTSINSSTDVFVSKFTSAGTLAYSTFLGGSNSDQTRSIAVDTSGAIYLSGATSSSDFPTTAGAYDTTANGANDVFVTKFAANGVLAYSTFIGGALNDYGWSMALDQSGAIYLTGETYSTAFPTTAGAYDTSYNSGADAFVIKFSTTTGLVYSTFLGHSGNDYARSIAVDGTGSIYVAGETFSSSFPTTAGAYDTSFEGGEDAFVAKFSTATGLVYSTLFGGNNTDYIRSIAVENTGDLYLTGVTSSSTFPTTAGAYDTSYNGGDDAFVAKFNTATGLIYGTFLGGSGIEYGSSIVTDGSGTSYITGETRSSNFPTTTDAFDTSHNGNTDVFVARVNATGGLAYSTYLGGNYHDYGRGIALDSTRATYVTGETSSPNFPTTNAWDASYNGGVDIFVVKLPSPAPPTYTEEYTYDVLGNLTSKTGLGTYTYGAAVSGCATGTPASKPHAVAQAGSITFSYDCNGNLLDGGGRIYTWNLDNRPSSIQHVSGTESYTYDADGERVTKSNGSVTTFYLGGLWEEDSTGATKAYYMLNGQIVGVRANGSSVTYLHGDHLGSISVVTDQAGVLVSQQSFDPWGKRRGSGAITQTSMNYTGQRLDITGLLYYHARYYDPALGRFISADTLVPGADTLAIGPAVKGGGPVNPQDLNRYSYVNNNPLNRTDPSGHCGTSGFWATAVSVMTGDCTRRAAEMFGKARTTEHKIITGAVAATSAVGAVAGWAGAALLAVAGGQALVGAVAGGGSAASITGTGTAVATTACADGDCGNEASAVAAAGNTAIRVAADASSKVQPMSVVRFIQRGEKLSNIINDLKALTFETGNEHALVKLTGGQRAIVTGGERGIDLGVGLVQRLYAHTHPYGYLSNGPSPQDRQALQLLGQMSSWLIERGEVLKFGRQ